MRHKSRRSIRAVALVTAYAIAMLPADVAAARPPSPSVVDITSTAQGQEAAAQAAAIMMSKYGISASADSLRVWDVGEGTIVGPTGSTITINQERASDGTMQQYLTATEPSPNGSDATQTQMSEASITATGWSLVGSSCYIDPNRGTVWMDVCYQKYKATSDGSSSYDYYALNMFSTFAAPGFGWEIGDPWIESSPAAGAAHTWFDWKPRSDSDQACSTTVYLTITVAGFPLTVAGNQCATWDITKYATAGKFRNKWTEGFCMIRTGETELEFEIASRVTQGGVPGWQFSWYKEADPGSCLY